MSSIAAAAGLGATGVAIADLAEKTANASQQIRNFHLYTGIPEKDIQQWENFAQTLGIAKGEISSFFATTKQAVGEMKLTGAGLGLMQAMGLDPNEEDPTKRFMQIRRAFRDENIPQAMKMALAAKLQMSQGMQALMNQPISDEEFLKRVAAEPFIKPEQITRWAELGTTWKEVAIDGEVLFASLTPIAWVLKAIGDALKEVIQFTEKYVEIEKEFGKSIGNFFGGGISGGVPNVATVNSGGRGNQTNHFSINITGLTSPEGIVKTIEDVIKRVVADAFYQDPGQQR